VTSDIVIVNPVGIVNGNLSLSSNSTITIGANLILFAVNPSGGPPLQVTGCAELAGTLNISVPSMLTTVPLLTQGDNCTDQIPQINALKDFIGCAVITGATAAYDGDILTATFTYDQSGCSSSSSNSVIWIAGASAGGAALLLIAAVMLLWLLYFRHHRSRYMPCLWRSDLDS